MNAAQLAILFATLLASGALLAALLTSLAIPLARRVGYVDHPGGHKSHQTATPYGGGAAIVAATLLMLAAAVVLALVLPDDPLRRMLGAGLQEYIGGVRLRLAPALGLIVGALVLFVLGLVDDLRPLGPWPKLVAIAGVALVTALLGVRIAAFLPLPLSMLVSVLWIVVITNAFNFLDNMDGLSGGVAALCALALAACGLLAGQVLIPALAIAFAGALLGFLAFNFPPARVFMGDAGSLFCGYMLAVISMLTTYWEASSAPPYALAMPLVALAVPLYDFSSVVLIRLAEGRNPLRGDQRHFSHRLVDHGLSRRGAVLTIYLATAATGLAATLLPGADLRRTLCILALVLMILAIIAILESPVQKRA